MHLVDVVVTEGEIGSGGELRIILGPPDGNLIQVQKHAQRAILMTGVDIKGDRTYQRAATFPTIQIVGASADRLRVFVPALVRPDEEFRFRVLPVDIYSFNPATGYQGNVKVVSEDAVQLPENLEVCTDSNAKGLAAPARLRSRIRQNSGLRIFAWT